jgi:osmotically-inducible protein OsmY
MGMNRGGAMGGAMGGRNQMNQNQNQKSNKPQIRATVKLGFQVPVRTSAATTRLINDRLQRIPSAALAGVSVEMSGRTAVIRGEVGSPEDGKMVERLLSLEPGVDAVRNELTFASGPALPTNSNMPVPPPVSPRS